MVAARAPEVLAGGCGASAGEGDRGGGVAADGRDRGRPRSGSAAASTSLNWWLAASMSAVFHADSIQDTMACSPRSPDGHHTLLFFSAPDLNHLTRGCP